MMRSEREKILKMLEEGKITADDALKLLETLEPAAQPAPASRKSKMIRIKVTSDGEEKVTVNLPISLAKVALRMAANFEPKVKDLDFDAIIDEMESGLEGRLVNVSDGDDRVEIYIE